jgi:hypothetical protein
MNENYPRHREEKTAQNDSSSGDSGVFCPESVQKKTRTKEPEETDSQEIGTMQVAPED